MQKDCCGCEKKIDLKDESYKDGKVQWYGTYQGNKCIKVICGECYADPEKKKKYMK